MPLQNTSLEGTLTIGSIAMQNTFGAWGICGDETGQGGLVHLWTRFDVRGTDRLLPGVTGVIAYQRRMAPTRHDLRLLVSGDIDGVTGTPYTDPVEGLAENLEYLRANVLAPVVSSTGTRAATLTVPGMANRTANIHVLGLMIQSYMIVFCQSVAVTTLQISIPGGRFA
jgi:hypothetical protein